MNNPLLAGNDLPPFSQILPEHVVPAISELINQCRRNLDDVVSANQGRQKNWQSLVLPLEEQGDLLSKAWSPVGHLNAVRNSPELREAYNASLSMLTTYHTELGHHRGLFETYQALAQSAEFEALSEAQKTAIEQELRDFRLAGVALPETDKKRYAEIQQRLSELQTQFANQVLDATQAWYRRLPEEGLAGIPDSARSLARQAAAARDVEGYVFTLDLPSYLAVMTYSDERKLREETYTAYVTRASGIGPNAGQWDNTPLMAEILQLRHESARMLGFANYAERSLATKMAQDCDQVEEFLLELARKSRAAAIQELEELRQFARERDGIKELQAWDQLYYSEKLRQRTYAISQEELRPYFPVDRVLKGLFDLVSRLFGIEIRGASAEVWHGDVRYYEITRAGSVFASFYLDLFARENKRGGAWMDECRNRRRRASGELQLPVAYMVCNFTPPVAEKPSLLTHTEVLTLFHEFGHGLHHMLTEIETSAVSGIHGVAWDAVELPSQFMENWCWEKSVIPMISGHHESGEPLPADLLDNLLAARNFQSALQMLRQIEFALFDFRLHRNYDSQAPRPVQAVLDEVRDEVAVITPPACNRFQNSFTHIFSGGYAAGYYSYKWAELLSSDAFSRFEEEGILNPATGASFLREILQKGGSRDAMTLFCNFRGREPSPDALLRHSGITG